MILIIDNFDSFTYNLAQMTALAGTDVEVLRRDEVTTEVFDSIAPDGLVVSPGPSHPDSIPDVAVIVRHALGFGQREHGEPLCPVLGVCLGHQLLARVFGATVDRAQEVVHGRISGISHDGRGIFRDLPTPLQVGRYHSLAVVEATLPPNLLVTARDEIGVIMGIRHRALPAEGVQFHPESILTSDGAAMLATFVESCRASRRPSGAFR